jgi:glycosyltransferase involved in cell wall biosynthesis
MSQMIKVLHIARYRHPTMEKKVQLLNAEPDLDVWCVRPASWSDEYGSSDLMSGAGIPGQVTHVAMLGQPNDPHRTLYRALTFSMNSARPDLIHAEEEPDSLAALQIATARRLFAPGAKLVLHTWQNVNRAKRWHVNSLIQMMFHQADAILCANTTAVRVLEEMRYRKVTAVIPPQGVDTSLFRPGLARPGKEPFTALFAGRFVAEKGLDTLMDAMCRLKASTRLFLIGDGPLREGLETRSRAAGLADRVEFHSPVSAEQMPALLAQADALVLPSRSTRVWQEQFGRVLVEAMACGIPVIGSDSGAIPEVIGDAGLIFREGDAAGLADCLSRLETSPKLRCELSELGLARVNRHFTQEVVAGQTAEFYRSLMGIAK